MFPELVPGLFPPEPIKQFSFCFHMNLVLNPLVKFKPWLRHDDTSTNIFFIFSNFYYVAQTKRYEMTL